MSQFLSEGGGQKASLFPEQATGEDDTALMQRVLGAAVARPDLIPDGFMSYVIDFVQANNLLIPFGQIIGASRLAAKIADRVETTFSTTSLTFVQSSDGGPVLSGVGDGSFFVLYGGALWTTATTANARMGISVNGAQPVNAISCPFNVAGTSVAGVLPVTLTNPVNTLEAYYASTDITVTASAAARWMIALRWANL